MFTRLATALSLVALVAPSAASAWTWPAGGEVIRGFDYGGGAYTATGHRGIDVAGLPGSEVLAPAKGQVTFAGSLPSNGRTVSILTPDGWAVTLTQLGTVLVSDGDGVAEGEVVGTIAASGEPVPHVQLGTRRADDPRGYVDPLTLLPPRQAAPPPAAAPAPATQAPQPPPVAVEPAPAETTPADEVLRGTAPAGAAAAVVARPVRGRRTSGRAQNNVTRSEGTRPPSRPAEGRKPSFPMVSRAGELVAPVQPASVASRTRSRPAARAIVPVAPPAPVEPSSAPRLAPEDARDSRPPWILVVAAALAVAGLLVSTAKASGDARRASGDREARAYHGRP